VLGNGVVVVATREKEQERAWELFFGVLILIFSNKGMKISGLNRK
jgi:hypothetical protein